MRDYIRTASGKRFPLLQPQTDLIDVYDIAHHLSHICRFTGATRFHYSVAQHALLLSYSVPAEYAFEALHHDDAEAYLNDVARPLKYAAGMEGYRGIETVMNTAIALRFGVPALTSLVIKEYDRRLCATEGVQLLPGYEPTAETLANVYIHEMSPREAREAYLRRHTQLYPGTPLNKEN